MQNTLMETYEQLMIPARQRFETSSSLATLLEEDIDPNYFELFLVPYV